MRTGATDESGEPAYVPFLEEVARIFHSTGEWPNADRLQRDLDREGRTLDVYGDLAHAGTRLAHLWSGDTSAIALTVRGLSMTALGAADLVLLTRGVQMFVTAYLGDAPEPEVSAADLRRELALNELELRKVSVLLDGFGFITGGGGERAGEGRYWRVGRTTGRFRSVECVEDLLRVLDEIEPPRPSATESSADLSQPPGLDGLPHGSPGGAQGWTPRVGDMSARHAFISYVREDADEVDRIQRVLEAAGVRVWRDTADLWPGEDWRIKIKRAITADSLVFVACFSERSVSRTTTYQNEELVLAVEQLRLRHPDQPWLIPVRLSDCDLPDYDLGAGRTLDSLQRVDLFGDRWDEGIARLVAGVLRLFASLDATQTPAPPVSQSEATPTTFVKGALLDPKRQIELEDYVMARAGEAAEACKDAATFPTTSSDLTNDNDGNRFLVSQANRYWHAVEPLLAVLIPGCAWGQTHHSGIWSRAMERVASTAKSDGGGQTALLDLRRYPILPLLYGGSLAASHRENFASLKALAIDAKVRTDPGQLPLIAAAHASRPFSHVELTAQLLALEADGEELRDDTIDALRAGRKSKRYTPVSDHLHSRLRPYFVGLIPDDEDYTAAFDRLEVLLGAMAADVAKQAADAGIYADGAWFGSFTWRDRRREPTLEQTMLNELESAGIGWLPVAAGIFGGDVVRARAGFESFIADAAHARHRRF